MGLPNSKIEHKPLEEAVKQIDLLNKRANTKIGEVQEIINDYEKYTNVIKDEKDMIIQKLYRLNAKSVSTFSKQTQTDFDIEIGEHGSYQGVVNTSTNFNKTDEETYYLICKNRQQHDKELNSMMKSNRQLENEIRHQTLKFENLKAEKMNLRKSIDQEREHYQNICQQRDSEFAKMMETTRLHKDETLEIEKLQTEKSRLNISIENIKYELNTCKEKIKAVDLEMHETKSYNQKLESALKKTKEENKNLHRTNIKLKTDLEEKEIKTEEKIKEQQLRVDNLAQKDRKNKEEKDPERILKQILKQIHNTYSKASWRTVNDNLLKEAYRLGKEIENLQERQRRKKEICFKSALRQSVSNIAVSGILSLLRDKMRGVDLEVVSESRIDSQTPLLVVFYYLSRITDDAKGALEKSCVKADSNVALIVLNQGNKNKELMSSSRRVLTMGTTGRDFEKLGLIVDMSFLTAEGIIKNELTNDAIEELAVFINTH